MGNIIKAEEFYLKSLKIFQSIYGENHADVAMSKFNLALIYETIGKKYIALSYSKGAYDIVRQIYGEWNQKTIKYKNYYQELLQ